MTFDTIVVPPGFVRGAEPLKDGKILLGMRVIESSLVETKTVPDGMKLKRVWDQNHGNHYILEKKFKSVPLAFFSEYP